ncbi:MAG: hypothetical protein HRT71_15160 [Flavobacteriales bacterium]|nr:hypothetical protein [Flavobacteriales bacterium]
MNLAIKKEITHFMSDLTPAKRKQVISLKEVKNPIEGIDYTYNPGGLLMFTGWYLLRRGNCCDNDCANCPYKK